MRNKALKLATAVGISSGAVLAVGVVGAFAQDTPDPAEAVAELATATGAAVQLSAVIGGEAVYLDAVDARIPLGLTAEPGAGYRQEPRLPEPTPNWAALHR